MRTFRTCRPRGLPFRLFIVLAGALLLTAALVPRANAQFRGTIVYFNFEDSTIVPQFLDTAADVTGAPDFNPGGGIEMSTLTVTDSANAVHVFTGLMENRTAGDIDHPLTNGFGLVLNHTMANEGASISFHADTTNLTQMSLSFGVNNQGNGYSFVTASYMVGGGPAVTIGGQTILNTIQTITFNVPVGAENHPDVTFILTFNNGQSNGNNIETLIDNIRLDALPEPATVVGGLLGVLGLCWFQRRRLIGSVRFRRT
jgi:hypothetical protein